MVVASTRGALTLALIGCFLHSGQQASATPVPDGEIARPAQIAVTPDVLLEHIQQSAPEVAALSGLTWADHSRRLIFYMAADPQPGAKVSARKGGDAGLLVQGFSLASLDVASGETTPIGSGYRVVAASRSDTVAYVAHGTDNRHVALVRTNGEKLCSLRAEDLVPDTNGVQALSVTADGNRLAIAIGYQVAAPKQRSEIPDAAVKVFDSAQRAAPTAAVSFWITDRLCRTPQRLLDLRGADVGRMVWLSDSESFIAMVATDVAGGAFPRNDLVLIDSRTGARRTLAPDIGGQATGSSLLAVDPSGKHVAFLYDQEKMPYPLRRQLAVASLADGQIRLVSNDPRRGTGWLDARTLWVTALQAHPLLASSLTLALDGVETALPDVPGNGVPSPDGRKLAWVESDLLGNSTISLATVRRGKSGWNIGERRTLWTKSSALARYSRAQRSLLRCESSDGVRPVAILTLPLDHVAGRRYPLIVDIHGGPRSGLESSRLPYAAPGILNMSTLEHDMWATKGYAVLAPDYRASGLYGYDKIPRDGSGFERDFEDIMCAVQAVVDRGIADGDRMAVIGHSYGGMEVTWAVTHSQRFKAAISKEGSTNVSYAISWGRRGESNQQLVYTYGAPYEFPERYRRMSVMDSIGSVTTPTMFVEHRGGKRPGDLYSWLFAAWQQRGVRAQLRQYDEQKHVLYSATDQRDLLYASIEWLDTYLGSDSSRPQMRTAIDPPRRP